MKKEKNNYYYSLIAVVAIVAVAGLVIMFKGSSCTEAYSGEEITIGEEYYTINEEGSIIDEEGNIVGEAAVRPIPKKPTKPLCIDTDMGINFYTAGKVYGKDKYENKYSYPDLCEIEKNSVGILTERYCKNNEPMTAPPFNCPSGICKNGACIADKEPYCDQIGTRSEGWYQYKKLLKYAKCNGAYALCKAVGTKSEGWYSSTDNSIIKYEICGKSIEKCTDTDGGQNYYEKGTVILGEEKATDFCWNYGDYNLTKYGACKGNETGCVLVEHSCAKDDTILKEKYQCPYGCIEGACIKY